jgi:hypothetical protein
MRISETGMELKKKRVIQAIALVIIATATPLIAFADTEPAPPPPGSEWSASVDVSDSCTVNDSDGVAHSYTGFLAVCALKKSVDIGAVTSVSLSNAFPSLGLFVTAIGGVAANPASEYWALYKNGSFASVGVTQLSIAAGDTIVLELHDFSDTYLGSRLTITINSVTSSSSSSGSSSSGTSANGVIIASDFDVPKAVSFLVAAQQGDGSMPTWLLSDWTALALASYGPSGARDKLRDYLQSSSPAMTNVTDYERHAMALLALGIDPYTGTGTDYITSIVEAFDGVQIGDPVLVNDDIFAVFPLLHAGYARSDDMLERIQIRIVGAQLPDGSWEGSVDLTAAALQALALFERTSNVKTAIDRAEGYLASQQRSDGGFGNSFSTAWVMQAIAAIGDSHTVWTKGLYRTPRYYFSELQQADGGVEKLDTPSNTRLWATAYAIPGVLGKTWDSIMVSFPKPVPATIPEGELATSTLEVTDAALVETRETDALESEPLADTPQETVEPELQENPVPVTASAAEQTASAVLAGSDTLAWGFAALLAFLTILAVIYSLLHGDRSRLEEKRS